MSDIKNILVILPLNCQQKQLLLDAAQGHAISFKNFEDVTVEDFAKANIIIGRAPLSLCPAATKLEWLQSHAAGPDAYLKEGLVTPNAIITNATGAYGLAVSEHMFAMTLMLMKRLHTYRDAQHLHVWKSQGTVSSLYGARVLVLGLGDIGSSYAKFCKSMGAYVTGIRRTSTEKPDYIDEMYLFEDIERLLPNADIIAISLPGTKETHHLFNSETIAKMKDGAFIINGGRGTVIDSDALVDALRSGKLAGAGLDVTDPEPLPADHPLWNEPNALITPHISGMFHLPETVNRLVNLSAENLKLFLSGQKPKNIVDRKTGYRIK